MRKSSDPARPVQSEVKKERINMRIIRYQNTPFYTPSLNYPGLRDEMDRLFDVAFPALSSLQRERTFRRPRKANSRSTSTRTRMPSPSARNCLASARKTSALKSPMASSPSPVIKRPRPSPTRRTKKPARPRRNAASAEPSRCRKTSAWTKSTPPTRTASSR